MSPPLDVEPEVADVGVGVLFDVVDAVVEDEPLDVAVVLEVAELEVAVLVLDADDVLLKVNVAYFSLLFDLEHGDGNVVRRVSSACWCLTSTKYPVGIMPLRTSDRNNYLVCLFFNIAKFGTSGSICCVRP